MAATVKFAVYGALKNQDDAHKTAWDVTKKLQEAINSGNGVVKIDRDSMGGDPINLVEKHFGAIVEVDVGSGRELRAFACKEGQTIDFT
jgi:hypothetical protein